MAITIHFSSASYTNNYNAPTTKQSKQLSVDTDTNLTAESDKQFVECNRKW